MSFRGIIEIISNPNRIAKRVPSPARALGSLGTGTGWWLLSQRGGMEEGKCYINHTFLALLEADATIVCFRIDTELPDTGDKDSVLEHCFNSY